MKDIADMRFIGDREKGDKSVLFSQSGRLQKAYLKEVRTISPHCELEMRNPKHETDRNDQSGKFLTTE